MKGSLQNYSHPHLQREASLVGRGSPLLQPLPFPWPGNPWSLVLQQESVFFYHIPTLLLSPWQLYGIKNLGILVGCIVHLPIVRNFNFVEVSSSWKVGACSDNADARDSSWWNMTRSVWSGHILWPWVTSYHTAIFFHLSTLVHFNGPRKWVVLLLSNA